MTVHLIVLDSLDTQMIGILVCHFRVVGHAIAHLLGDVLNDDPVIILEQVKLSGYAIELDEYLPVLLIWATFIECLVLVVNVSIEGP